MRLLVSCPESGSVKEIVCNIGADSSKKDSLQAFSVETSISEGSSNKIDQWYSFKNEVGKMIVARNNGVLQLVNRKNELKEQGNEEEGKKIQFNVSKFELLDFFNDDEGLLSDKRLEPLFAKSKKRTKLTDAFVCITPLNKEETKFILGTKSGFIHIIELNEKFTTISKSVTHKVKAPLEFVQLYDNEEIKDGHVFAVGGEENLAKLFKLSTDFQELKQIWEAKNVKNDRLDMRVPVWPMALKFFNPSETPSNDNSKLNYQFAIITRYSHLGIYQTQHGKKPLHYLDILPNREPLTSLELVGEKDQITDVGNIRSADINNFQFITTDTRKDILKYNSKGRLLGKYGKSDVVGAVSCVKVIAGDKYVVETGLDRYLRIFDATSLRTLIKIYIGSKSNFVELIDDSEVQLPEPANSKDTKKRSKNPVQRAAEEEEDAEEDPDALWNTLEKGNKKAKKA